MLRATGIIVAKRATGEAPPPFDRVRLDWDHRHRRRLSMVTDGGAAFLLDLPSATALRSGDLLLLTDGRTVAVEAEPEPLAEITAADGATLLRIAWHLGNRHLPTQLRGETLRVRRDHVIEDMVTGLGGRVQHVMAPFDPEGGAYGHGHTHGHGHGADHAHG